MSRPVAPSSSAPPIVRRLAAPALAGLALTAAGAGWALAAPYNPENLPAEQIGQIEGICRSVVGLQPGGRAFSTCTESLSRSAAKLDRNSDLQRVRKDCVAKGLRPGEPALAQCEVAATSDTGAPQHAASPATRPQAASRVKSYFNVSWQEAHQRHRLACAALGYDPAGAGFYNCVANLQAAMFRVQHPST